MKILHVLDHSIPMHSGYTFRTRSILNQQRNLGWSTEHITSAKHTVESETEEEVEGLRFYRTPIAHAWMHRIPVLQHLAIIWDLSRRIDEVLLKVEPDVIHAHSPALNGLAALKIARKRKIPLVYECRAFWEDAAVNHGSCDNNSLRYRLTRALETYVFKSADVVTTICEGLRNDIIARGIAPDKVVVIPNAVDVEKFLVDVSDRTELAHSLKIQNSTVLGFFGSFYEYEGIELLLEAMPKILNMNTNVKLLLVGGGPEESAIRSKIQSLNLEQYVRMIGRVSHNDIQNYYHLTDIMVYPRLPMRLTELVTPLKPLEAMAKEKLVVASDVGGHRELIDNGSTGYLFQSGSAQALSDCITQALTDKHLWPKIHQQGRRFVENDRTWKRSVSFYKDVYGRLCGY